MNIIRYSAKIDWWQYPVLILCVLLVAIILLVSGIEWYIVLILVLVLTGVTVIPVFTIYYVIKDDELGVRDMYSWRWYPIESIKEVEKITSIATAPATSFKRIAIRFERGTIKGSLPLEISPKDVDGFISDLLRINSEIKVH